MTGSVPPPDAAEEGGGTATLAVSGVVVAFAVVSGALRFYTRIFTRSGLKWDDWLILAAVIVTLMTAALLLWGTHSLLSNVHLFPKKLSTVGYGCCSPDGVTDRQRH